MPYATPAFSLDKLGPKMREIVGDAVPRARAQFEAYAEYEIYVIAASLNLSAKGLTSREIASTLRVGEVHVKQALQRAQYPTTPRGPAGAPR